MSERPIVFYCSVHLIFKILKPDSDFTPVGGVIPLVSMDLLLIYTDTCEIRIRPSETRFFFKDQFLFQTMDTQHCRNILRANSGLGFWGPNVSFVYSFPALCLSINIQ